MNRRNFLGSLIGGVAATAAIRTWPFRVFSFPTNLAMPLPDFTIKYINPSMEEEFAKYREGIFGESFGFDWYVDEILPCQEIVIPSRNIINPERRVFDSPVLTLSPICRKYTL